MRRKDKEVKDLKQIEAIIHRAAWCRIGLCDGLQPYVVPVNFGYRDRCLYFHSTAQGKKMEIIKKNNQVCFQMDTDVEIVKRDTPCHWTVKYASVIGFGKALLLETEEDKRRGLEIIFEHYSDTVLDFSPDQVSKVAVIKVEVESLWGKVSGKHDFLAF